MTAENFKSTIVLVGWEQDVICSIHMLPLDVRFYAFILFPEILNTYNFMNFVTILF